MNMDFMEFTGKTIDEALTEVVIKLETTIDKIVYEVIEPGSNGFLGIGRKPVRIRAMKKCDAIKYNNTKNEQYSIYDINENSQIDAFDDFETEGNPIISSSKFISDTKNMYCTKCGKMVAEEDVFCANCGNRIKHQKNQFNENLPQIYKVFIPAINPYTEAHVFPKLKTLLIEVLGYNNEECDKIIENQAMCDIATNLTAVQAQLIIQPFRDNDILICLMDKETDEFIKEPFEIIKQPPKQHYYDKPVVGREYLIDPFKPKPIIYPTHSNTITKPQIECPYCHSANTKKISGLSKAGNVAVWGVFAVGKVSKTWHCNNCKSDF